MRIISLISPSKLLFFVFPQILSEIEGKGENEKVEHLDNINVLFCIFTI